MRRSIEVPIVERELLRAGELVPQGLIAVLELIGHLDDVDLGTEVAARLQVEEPAGDVLAGDVDVARPHAVGQVVAAFGGLGVDEVRHQCTGVPAEQQVRQRAVAPEEPLEMQAHQQHHGGVDEEPGQVGAPLLGEQVPVGQGEVEVAADEHRCQRLPVRRPPPGDHACRPHGGKALGGEAPQHAVLAAGVELRGLLESEDPALRLPRSGRRGGSCRAPCRPAGDRPRTPVACSTAGRAVRPARCPGTNCNRTTIARSRYARPTGGRATRGPRNASWSRL